MTFHLDAEAWLRGRAESYGRDATTLRRFGETDAAVIYETIRDELRRCAHELAESVKA